MLGGAGTDRDVAVDAQGNPDNTGRASDGGAVVSGNGSYVFYYTQASSNLAPTAIANPADDDVYLVRQNLISGLSQVASIAADGKTPVPVFDPGPSPPQIPLFLATDSDGSAVAYALPATKDTSAGAEYVHDFTTGTTWQIASGATDDTLYGVSGNGTIVTYGGTGTGGVGHIYRQVQGGSPQQIDSCASTSPSGCGTQASMSSDGNLIAYEGPGANGDAGIYLYDATDGYNANLFPANTANGDQLTYPLISADGSHILASYASATNPDAEGLVIKQVSGDKSTTVTASDIRVPYLAYEIQPMSISTNGSAFAYWADDPDQENGWFALYHAGKSQIAPQLTSSYPETADITGDGSSLVYTATMVGVSPLNYPGVYEWQLP
jgi:hypothetical protein